MEEHKTDILSDEQIENAPAGNDDQPWRERLATAQHWEDFVMKVRGHWSDADLSDFEHTMGDHDGLVSAVSKATGLDHDAVEKQLNSLKS